MSRSWDTLSAVEAEELLTFVDTPEIKIDPDNETTKQLVRSIVTASWRWQGLTQATMTWLTLIFRGSKVDVETAADVGTALNLEVIPTLAASTMQVDNFDHTAADTLLEGWKFMVWDDPTIYTLTANGTVVDAGAYTLTVTPAITAKTVALGAGTPVHFFKPTIVRGKRSSGDETLNRVTVMAEFETAFETVNQPEVT